jgi:hypothetical protein
LKEKWNENVRHTIAVGITSGVTRARVRGQARIDEWSCARDLMSDFYVSTIWLRKKKDEDGQITHSLEEGGKKLKSTTTPHFLCLDFMQYQKPSLSRRHQRALPPARTQTRYG